jgi:tight adherence protein C
MDAGQLLSAYGFLWSPPAFAAAVALTVLAVWMALAPARNTFGATDSTRGYREGGAAAESLEDDGSLIARAIGPAVRSLLRLLGRLMPGSDAERMRLTLEQAGYPLGLSVVDFYGLRIALLLTFGGGYYALVGRNQAVLTGLGVTAIFLVVGFLLPGMWLNSRARGRQHQMMLAFPDMLDMLTIGVEAGLGFESAMMRVSEKWDNPLALEFRRTVDEMRVGLNRNEALTRMGERTGLEDIQSFVATLVQSSTMGVSIAQMLHDQAAEVRTRRRMRAEEMARKAGTKMLLPLVFLIFPTMFVVILGPAVPTLIDAFSKH